MKFNGFTCDKCGNIFEGKGKTVVIEGKDYDYCKSCIEDVKPGDEVPVKIKYIPPYIEPCYPWYPYYYRDIWWGRDTTWGRDNTNPLYDTGTKYCFTVSGGGETETITGDSDGLINPLGLITFNINSIPVSESLGVLA